MTAPHLAVNGQPQRAALGPGWKIALTLTLLAVLLSRVDGQTVLDVLGRLSLWWLLPVVLIQLFDRWLMAWKWRLLLNAEENYISTFDAFKVYYIAGFQGFVVPFGIGPDIVRFVRLRGTGIPQERLAASLILERAIGTIATGLSAALAFLVFLYLLRGATPGWMIPTVLVVTVAALVSLVFMRSPRFRRWVGGLPGARRVGRRVEGSPWWLAIAAYSEREGVLLRFLFWSIVEQFTTVLAVWFVALAMGVPLGFLAFVAAVPIIQLLERLPLTVMGLGIREGSFAFLLGLLGVGYSEAILMALLEFTVFVVTLLPAGMWDLRTPGALVPSPEASLSGAERLPAVLEKEKARRG
jgi:glycosyltransferase 2 family protein